MSFFKSNNNQNKYYVYLLVNKSNLDSNENNSITTKVLISKSLILHEFSYLINNFEKLTNEQNEREQNKIIHSFTLNYNFKYNLPSYPYDLFYINRILLYSFMYICEDTLVKDLLKEKIHFISNINYLKRIKDWSVNWKKNRFSIEKYQHGDSNIESIFSIYTLSDHYFNILKENLFNNEVEINFTCTKISQEEKTTFERISERPNTDLIEKCFPFFNEHKQIRFL
jgi:hypothetical protein